MFIFSTPSRTTIHVWFFCDVKKRNLNYTHKNMFFIIEIFVILSTSWWNFKAISWKQRKMNNGGISNFFKLKTSWIFLFNLVLLSSFNNVILSGCNSTFCWMKYSQWRYLDVYSEAGSTRISFRSNQNYNLQHNFWRRFNASSRPVSIKVTRARPWVADKFKS